MKKITTAVLLIAGLLADTAWADNALNVALFKAISDDNAQEVQSLVSRGADINARDVAGRTPLHQSILHGKPNSVKFLLEHGADVNAKDKSGATPLYLLGSKDFNDETLSKDENTKLIDLLISHGADVNAETQNCLGKLYANGSKLTTDYKQAFNWFNKAAKQGNVDAELNLGLMYFNGFGVAQDNKQAYIWFSVAAENGPDPLASKSRDAAAAKLTSKELESANIEVDALIKNLSYKTACVRYVAPEPSPNAPPEFDGPGSFGALQDTVTLGCLTYVGSIMKDKKENVLIKDEQGVIHQLVVGDYMGENHGVISKIDEEAIYIDQIIYQDKKPVTAKVTFFKYLKK